MPCTTHGSLWWMSGRSTLLNSCKAIGRRAHAIHTYTSTILPGTSIHLMEAPASCPVLLVLA